MSKELKRAVINGVKSAAINQTTAVFSCPKSPAAITEVLLS